MILQETIDKVFALDIVDVISRYVQLKRSGSNYKGFSPFSQEKTPSFMVSPAKGIFKCFSTGKGGNLVTFIMEKEFYNFPEAIKHLCQMFNIEYLESERTDEEKLLAHQKENLYIINSVANEYYKAHVNHFVEVLEYLLVRRKLTADVILKFELGFAPNTLSGLTNHLINNGYNWQIAVQASVLGHHAEKNKLYDRFRNRVMFPIKSLTGNIVGFGARILEQQENVAKYLNSSDSFIYNKSEVLYGIYESKKAIVDNDFAFLCEGYLDVVKFHQQGVENIVASSGTALTIEQIKLLKRFTKNIVIMFDSDDAGMRATMRSIDLILTQGMNVKILTLPDGQDPDDFATTRTKEQILDYTELNKKDFIIFKLNYLLEKSNNDLAIRSTAINEVVNSISKMNDPVKREVYLQECARITEMNFDVLRKMLVSITNESVDFQEVTIETFNENMVLNRSYIKEQCERKILQYVLAYGSMTLPFKEINLFEIIVDEKPTFIEEVEIVNRSVLEKVILELDNDNIQISNIMFLQIFEKAKTIDLSDLNNLKDNLPDDMFLLSLELAKEEKTTFQNTFVKEEFIKEQFEDTLQKTINETLMYYKSIIIENLIIEESNTESPNYETIQMMIDLLIKIKLNLNFI